MWNWRGQNAAGATAALGDWESIALKGRRVYVAFDCDVLTKRDVRSALQRLGGFLAARGAEVRYVHLPHDGDAKTGLDDYLAAGGSADNLVHVGHTGTAGRTGHPRQTGAHPHTRA